MAEAVAANYDGHAAARRTCHWFQPWFKPLARRHRNAGNAGPL